MMAGGSLACSENSSPAVLEGQIRGLSAPAEITVQKEHIHYKFSDPVLETRLVSEDGTFRFEFSGLEKPKVMELQYEGQSHPVYIKPGQQQYISFNAAAFPKLSGVSGPPAGYYEAYQQYLEELETAERHLRSERRKMRAGEPNDVLNIERLKIQIAKEYLANTPFSHQIKHHLGEFLTSSLEYAQALFHGDTTDEEALASFKQRRSEALEMAVKYNFFARYSLEAQRAGIRDFATAWAETAPPASAAPNRGSGNDIAAASAVLIDTVFEGSAEQARARELKWNLLSEIEDPAGQRHAVMYLIAEELGEGDFETGQELLRTHKTLLKEEPRLLGFLETLEEEVDLTQPGQPAIPFTIADEHGNAVSLSDFEGRYVLLDFWASWCVPCIDALPELEAHHAEFGASDLEIVSISVEENEQLWRNALQRFPQPWTQLYDGTGFDQETFRAYRAGSIPYYVLIGRDGKILRNNDFSPGEEFAEYFSELLKSEVGTIYATQ